MLAVGQSIEVEQKIEANICSGKKFCGSFSANTNPPDGNTCEDADEFCFQLPAPDALPPPPPSPTMNPVCPLDVAADCVITDNTASNGLECSSPIVGVEPCLARPTSATMLFNGGNCDQSDNVQELKFTCQDSNGGPPTEFGQEAHILVTDIKGNGIVYFDGIVPVGSFFPLNDGGERFEADQFVTISTPDRSTVLQEVQYHSSCSQNLELKNRFGASQLVGFFNDVQGNVTCFNTFEFSLGIDVPITVTGETVTLTSMIVETNFAGVVDLTPQVAGQVAGAGGSVVVTLSGEIDTSNRREYLLVFNLEGVREDGTICTGFSQVLFEAGNVPGAPRPPSFRRNLQISL